jgi:Alkylmercury lyase
MRMYDYMSRMKEAPNPEEQMADADVADRVRREIYRLFIAGGSCPTKRDLAESLGQPLPVIADAYQALANAHMLVLQPENGEVLMANPLSAVPTPFLVETDHPTGTRTWYGNCIWDALGIISMLETDGRVMTSCGCCGERMAITVLDKQPRAQPAGVAHFALPARRWWDDIVYN